MAATEISPANSASASWLDRLDRYAPLLGAVGILCLIFWGGENWLYRIPTQPAQQPAAGQNYLPPDARFSGGMSLAKAALTSKSGERLAVTGWVSAKDAKLKILKVIVLLDGNPVAEAANLQPVATPKKENPGSLRWSAEVPLPHQTGEHLIVARAVTASGVAADFASAAFTVAN